MSVTTLTRGDLTAALAARQMLIARARLAPAEAIRRLTPLQGQHAPAPYIALAARLDGFARPDLEAAIAARQVVKTTVMRSTLHLAAADEYPAYAQLARSTRMRAWRKRYAHLDERAVTAELRRWLRTPRSNAEIRARVERYEGVRPVEPWGAIDFIRTLLPLVQLPPAGYWNDRRRPLLTVYPRRLPGLVTAARTVVRRYLGAFGPASRRDIATWAGIAQRELAEALAGMRLVAYRDAAGVELLDLPGQPLPGAGVELPVRLLAHWDQPLLAYADRERILPAALREHDLTIVGATTVTVDGRVAGRWEARREGERAIVTVTPLVDIGRAARAAIREEARRTALFCEPDARSVSVVGT